MADKNGTLNRYTRLVGEIGRSALSSLYPDDFEFYLCALELVDDGSTIDYFVFPVQPSSIQKTEPVRTNIKSSMSGISVLRNSAVIPQEIVIRGNFGRNFKILSMSGVAFGIDTDVRDFSVRSADIEYQKFSGSVKTGYGATKILQNIISGANKVSVKTSKPQQLYFYNMALGESYLVTPPPAGLVLSQSQEMNMIWQYTLNMTVLAPLYEVYTTKNEKLSSRMLLSNNAIQKLSNAVARDTLSFITSKTFTTRIATV